MKIKELIKIDPESRKIVIKLKAPKDKEIKKMDVSFTGEELLKALKKRTKDLKRHFKYDGWDINVQGTSSDILYDLLGFHITELIDAYIMENTDTVLEYRNAESYYCKEEGHSPVYYDEYTGEVFVVNEPQNKEYLFKYSENDGYIYLGGL